jgi:glycine betaine/proline transport system substrate-binding protein
MKFLKIAALPLIASAMLGCSQQAEEASAKQASVEASKPGAGIAVKGFHSPIAEEKFQSILINRGLTALGYDVQPLQEVEYGAGYSAIAQNDIQWMAVSWDPLHNDMYKNSGGDKKFVKAGYYITGAAQGYLIDKATAEKHNIDTIDDLKKPEIAKLFDANGDGKADLTGCQPGWGCEKVINHQLDAFELRDTVNHIQGSYAAIISDTITRFKAGEPVLYYTWTPYWVSGVLVPGRDVVWLEVPHSEHPQGLNTELANGKNYGFSVNSERIVANRAFTEANPAAGKLFEVASLSINAVSAQNKLVADGENTETDVQRHADNWIKNNQETFDGWLEQARSASK